MCGDKFVSFIHGCVLRSVYCVEEDARCVGCVMCRLCEGREALCRHLRMLSSVFFLRGAGQVQCTPRRLRWSAETLLGLQSRVRVGLQGHTASQKTLH